MAWRLAKSLETLRAQINAAYPARSRASDGAIGDTAHSARKSDHNPDKNGIVRALDLTHDPKNGVDIAKLVTALIAGKDKRISYIIANGEIVSGNTGKSPWRRRKYTGANKHTKHVHISVLENGQDDTTPWNIGQTSDKPAPTQADAILKLGSDGPFVVELQRNLTKLGFGLLKPDGKFGPATEVAVRRFQGAHGLNVDGWAGPRTLDAIGKATGAVVATAALAPKLEEAEKSIPETAVAEVEHKTSTSAWLVGLAGGAGTAASAAFSAPWQTIAAVGVLAIVLLLAVFLLRNRILATFKEINKDAKS